MDRFSNTNSVIQFIDNTKDIVIISTDAISGTEGSALVNMLLLSLFYYQHNNPKKHIAVFTDEIHNQKLSSDDAITQILKEGRKYHISLNYATQFLPSYNKDILEVMNLAAIKIFLQSDEISAKVISKTLNIPVNVLCSMNQGECYVSRLSQFLIFLVIFDNRDRKHTSPKNLIYPLL